MRSTMCFFFLLGRPGSITDLQDCLPLRWRVILLALQYRREIEAHRRPHDCSNIATKAWGEAQKLNLFCSGLIPQQLCSPSSLTELYVLLPMHHRHVFRKQIFVCSTQSMKCAHCYHTLTKSQM